METILVAVGVLIDDAGRVLIARRAAEAHQGGLWEFPGGKVNIGESVTDALTRELQEELGVIVGVSEPTMKIHHDYGDKHVSLDVHRVSAWRGEPRGLEGQPLAWVSISSLNAYEFPVANEPIVKQLQDLIE